MEVILSEQYCRVIICVAIARAYKCAAWSQPVRVGGRTMHGCQLAFFFSSPVGLLVRSSRSRDQSKQYTFFASTMFLIQDHCYICTCTSDDYCLVLASLFFFIYLYLLDTRSISLESSGISCSFTFLRHHRLVPDVDSTVVSLIDFGYRLIVTHIQPIRENDYNSAVRQKPTCAYTQQFLVCCCSF